jgi:hypothetical protein
MSTLAQIEDAVRKLTPADQAAFDAWYEEYKASEWDKQIERDIASGRLDWLAAEAKADHAAGRCTDL